MIDWQHLTPDARNQLVAVYLFGWQPEPCPPGTQAVWSDAGLQYQCSICGVGAETPEQIEHGPINPYPCYSQDMNAAWEILKWVSDHSDYDVHQRFIYAYEHGRDPEYVCEGTNTCAPFIGLEDVYGVTPERICIAALRAIGLEVQV